MPLTIRIALAQQQSFDLLCGNQSRRVDWKELAALADEADREYFGDGRFPQLIALGKRLYQWLDGPEGWLRTGLANGETTLLLDLAAPLQAQDLNPATHSLLRRLAHLPWELLHDGKVFLAERGIQPVRKMQARTANGQPANRPLRLLFMATAPEGVLPVLNYEREEATILEATSKQPIELVVEESGSVAQLQNLVASFGEDHFDVFHITGHGFIDEGTPKFLTEDEQGGEQSSTAGQLAEAFGGRWPRLLFLSGCHTAEAPDHGMIPSMAHALVDAGANAVLGWARPVYDSTGILAATCLYKALATGKTPREAVAEARREMLRTFLQNTNLPNCSDWHLLRLYQGIAESTALVTPRMTRGRARIAHRPPEAEFLDAEGKVKVAGNSAFFGRRRETQRCIKALADPSDYYGVYLYGIGGYGKSTIAARLCRRHEALDPGFERVVLTGPVEEDGLRRRLCDKFGAISEAVEILNQPKIEFRHQLAQFFEIIEGKDRRLLLVLDDFEQNIPEAQVMDGSLRLAHGAWKALAALCFALEESNAACRLIVTCRYYSKAALPPNRLFVERLSGMAPIDMGKKVRALAAGASDAERQREKKIVEVADGNPQLFEWLMALAARKDLVDDAFLVRLEAVTAEFREKILAEKLIAALAPAERKALARMTLFRLAVPLAVVAELAHGASLETAASLGLLEKQVAQDEDLYRVTTVLEPLLRPDLSEGEWSEARRQAARKLHEVWWERKEQRREARGFEIVRLAVAAGEQELAVGPADVIATYWINRSRFLEALALCRLIPVALHSYRILGIVALAEKILGDTASARSHFEKALSACPPSEEREKAVTMYNLAGLEAQQGNVERALDLWAQSLEIQERVGELQGKAATLDQIAGVFAQRGEMERALDLWERSSEIYERIGDVRGKAATLHNMAIVIAQQGDIEQALNLWRQGLEIYDRIGEVRGKGATLHQIARQSAAQGKIEEAMGFWRQSLEIYDRIGEVRGKAVILQQMARMVAHEGETERALGLWEQSLEIQERIGDMEGKATTLGQMARVIAQQGDSERALDLWRQSREIQERIGDVKGIAVTLHQVAGVIAQQGETERALELRRQAMEILERLGDVQGKAIMLAEDAWAAGKSGDDARRDQLNLEAAKALGSLRAYLDLIVVLGNLGSSAERQREVYAAQAAWLVMKVQAPVDASVRGLIPLFDAIAQGDALEPLVAGAAMIVVITRGKKHPQLEELRRTASKMLSVAATNAGIQSQEALNQWIAEKHLADRAHVFPLLLSRLEELIGDRWLFDRTPLLKPGD